MWHPEIPEKYRNKLVEGDARALSECIPDKSCDFILCDPIYSNLDDYLWLARTAERVLKPDRALLVFCSDIKMFQIKALMDSAEGLTFVKPFYYVVEAKGSKLRGYGIFTWTTPALLYVKGSGWPKRTGRQCPDTKIEQATFISRTKPKGKFKWNKNPEVLGSWIRSFTEEGELVFDPYTGSGSVPYVATQEGRRYIAFEIDPSTAALARERLSAIQMMIEVKVSQESIFKVVT